MNVGIAQPLFKGGCRCIAHVIAITVNNEMNIWCFINEKRS
jgi:hypothetical protein